MAPKGSGTPQDARDVNWKTRAALMNFLNPAAIAIAAGLTIPPLIALYFLKLKRTVRPVPSTLLWKRSVEDLQVNSPFQRLRRSLLLLLQLLVLIVAAFALGKPMFQTVDTHEGTIIILIDQSASMAVVEADGVSRLQKAKEQARLCVENMSDDARAMVIAFCDRATVVSSFDTDKRALMRKIDSIKQTQSRSSLAEAVSLAEAYAQNIMIGTEEAGSEIAPESAAPPASVFLFTDGRIEDADAIALQRFDVDKIRMTTVGTRSDNVGVIAMDARRHYEHPEVLEVAATVQNFGDKPVAFDAVLYVDGQNVDIQVVELDAAPASGAPRAAGFDPRGRSRRLKPADYSRRVVAFDQIEFEGHGTVEVVLRVDDALAADDRAWAVIEGPRHLRVLLVTEGNLFLENVLATLPLDHIRMTGPEYEAAADNVLMEDERSAFDVVIMDRHSTSRLPQGNYFFFGAVPLIEGVGAGQMIDGQVIFNWDDTHPILRHVAVESLDVYEWLDLTLPPEAVSLVDGETSPVIAYLTRDASQFLICAFSLITEDDVGNLLMNTYWVAGVDFVVFMQNAVQYLAANVATIGKKSVAPGQPVTLPIPKVSGEVTIHRPDGVDDRVPAAGYHTIHYARTRRVGPYRLEPGIAGDDVFAVNLFNAVESRIEPLSRLTMAADSVEGQAGAVEVNEPAWPYLLLAILGLLLVEWIVYNHRVFI